MQVDRSRLEHTLRHRIDHYTAEASELGFPVGQWPQQITVDKQFGNGNSLSISKLNHRADGELMSVEYRQLFGCIGITVFND